MKNSEELFIIAELSANHKNDLNITLRTIDEIAKSGADAVKIQTYTADSLTLDVDNEIFGPRQDGLWKGKSLYELYTEGSLPYEWHSIIKDYAESLGLVFFSSPFDKAGVDLLESLNVSLYKIASPEITDIQLIEYVASKGKPIIISTGMASLSDIELAIETCKKTGNHDITLLKCTSEYPASPDMANLLTIPNIKDTFNVRVGLSDHSFGSTLPIVAVSLGATVIEKHFVLNRENGGIDADFSMEPDEFADMVKSVKEAKEALGVVTYNLTDRNKLRRRSLFVIKNIKEGELITEKNVRSLRPGFGMHPRFLKEVLGKKAAQDLKVGTPLTFSVIN